MDYLSAKKDIQKIANVEPSDIDWLFCEVLSVKRNKLSMVKEVSKADYKKLVKYAKRLGKGMPLSIALGFTWFYGSKIYVNSHVLTPREETEELCDLLIKDIAKSTNKPSVLDLCCGSGACGIVIKKTLPNSVVTLSDISKHAIKTSKYNAKQNNVDVLVIKSDMFAKINGTFDYIICNPPYIAYNDPRVEQRVNKWEPHLALYAEDDGYKFYKILASNMHHLKPGGKLYLEVGIDMAHTVAELFKDQIIEIAKDMQGVDRFVIVTKK